MTYAKIKSDLSIANDRIAHWRCELATITDPMDSEIVYAAERLTWWVGRQKVLLDMLAEAKENDQ